MRKLILGGVIIIFAITVFLNLNKEKEIRVRIIPNSDTSLDLNEKETAKTITLCYLKNAYDEEYKVFIQNINFTKKEFEKILEKELNRDVEVEFGNHTLYNKTYNNSAVKNTEEMTLYIIIGEGKGSNWWGTVYPEFLSVSGSEEIKYESLIVSIFKKIKGE